MFGSRVLTLLLAAAATGCPSTDTFQCVSDAQCGGDGQCEANEYCSFPDETCDSARRYGNDVDYSSRPMMCRRLLTSSVAVAVPSCSETTVIESRRSHAAAGG